MASYFWLLVRLNLKISFCKKIERFKNWRLHLFFFPALWYLNWGQKVILVPILWKWALILFFISSDIKLWSECYRQLPMFKTSRLCHFSYKIASPPSSLIWLWWSCRCFKCGHYLLQRLFIPFPVIEFSPKYSSYKAGKSILPNWNAP